MLQPADRHAREGRRPSNAELEQIARWMDSAFEVPGVGLRFGLDAIIGLIPGVGDALTSAVSLYILQAASRCGVPRITLLRMAMNLGLDYLLGAIPLVGDLFDVYWKANVKNVALVHRHLQNTPPEEQRARRGDWLFVTGLCIALILLLIGCIVLALYLVTWLGHLLLARSG